MHREHATHVLLRCGIHSRGTVFDAIGNQALVLKVISIVDLLDKTACLDAQEDEVAVAEGDGACGTQDTAMVLTWLLMVTDFDAEIDESSVESVVEDFSGCPT